MVLTFARFIQPDNYMLVCGALLVGVLALAWFLLRLFITLFFGGRMLSRIAWMHKTTEPGALGIAEPPLFGKGKH